MSNATLARVQAGGGAEDYTTAAGAAGTDKWSGTARAFVSDQDVSDDTGERSSVLVERSIAVDDALSVAWERGDTVTYTYRDTVLTGVVQDIKITASAGRLPGLVRLKLSAQ